MNKCNAERFVNDQAVVLQTSSNLYMMVSPQTRWMYVTSVTCLAEWLRRWTRNHWDLPAQVQSVACALLLRVLMRGPLDRRRPPRSPPGACQRRPEVRGRASSQKRAPEHRPTEYRGSGLRVGLASLCVPRLSDYDTRITCAVTTHPPQPRRARMTTPQQRRSGSNRACSSSPNPPIHSTARPPTHSSESHQQFSPIDPSRHQRSARTSPSLPFENSASDLRKLSPHQMRVPSMVGRCMCTQGSSATSVCSKPCMRAVHASCILLECRENPGIHACVGPLHEQRLAQQFVQQHADHLVPCSALLSARMRLSLPKPGPLRHDGF